MPALADLVVNLTAETAVFTRRLDEAHRDAKKFADNVERSLGALKTFGTTLVAALGIDRLAEFVNRAAQSAEALNKMSQAYGIAVGTLSTFNYAAKLSDVETEALAKGMGKLAKAADENSPALKRIGVSARDSAGQLRPLDDLMLDVSDRFAAMKDGTGKTAIALDIFGKSGAQLIPLLNQGRDGLKALTDEAERLGFKLTTETAQAAEQFEDNIKRLHAVSDGLALQLVSDLAPSLVGLTNELTKVSQQQDFKLFIQTAGDLVRGFIIELDLAVFSVKSFASSWADAWDEVKALAQTLPHGGAFASATQVPAGGSAALDQYFARSTQRAGELQLAWDRVKARMDAVVNPPPLSAARTGGTGLAPEQPEDLAKLAAEMDTLNEKTRALLESTGGDKLAKQIGDVREQISKLQAFAIEHPKTIWASMNEDVNKLNTALTDLQSKMLAVGDAQAHAAALFGGSSRAGDLTKLPGFSDKSKIDSILSIPVAAPRVSGEVQAAQELLKLQTDVNAQNQAAAQIYGQTRSALESYDAEMRRLALLLREQAITPGENARAVRQLRDSYASSIDPMIRYKQQLAYIADVETIGSASEKSLEAARKEANLELIRGLDEIALKTGSVADGFNVFLRESAQQMSNMAQQGYHLAASFQNSFENAFVGIISGTQSLADGFRTMAQSILADLARLIFETLIWKSISGWLGGVFGGGGGFGSLSASVAGGVSPGGGEIFSGGLGPILHDWPGPARGGQPYMIGTPEIFIPKGDGYITPLGGAKVGGDNYSVTVNAPNAAPGMEEKIEAAVARGIQVSRKLAMHDQINLRRRT